MPEKKKRKTREAKGRTRGSAEMEDTRLHDGGDHASLPALFPPHHTSFISFSRFFSFSPSASLFSILTHFTTSSCSSISFSSLRDCHSLSRALQPDYHVFDIHGVLFSCPSISFHLSFPCSPSAHFPLPLHSLFLIPSPPLKHPLFVLSSISLHSPFASQSILLMFLLLFNICPFSPSTPFDT